MDQLYPGDVAELVVFERGHAEEGGEEGVRAREAGVEGGAAGGEGAEERGFGEVGEDGVVVH